MYIPGLEQVDTTSGGIYRLDPNTRFTALETGVTDRAMLHKINSESTALIRQAVTRGIIQPLQLKKELLPQGTEVGVARPDTGKFTGYSVVEYGETDGSMLIRGLIERDSQGNF